MKIPILYEDKDILVINKPAGLVVHSDGRTKEKTLVDWILKKYPKVKNVGEDIIQKDGTVLKRPGIVHRIDRDTSGVLVIAKNQKSFLFLKKQFQDREIYKVYHAFLYGELKEVRGMIDRPIGRSSTDFRKWTAQRGRGEEREAVTYFKMIIAKDGFSFVEAIPKTGRTHQIRVHFRAIDYPIVMDALYAPESMLKNRKQLGFQRHALHARSIEIELINGNKKEIVAPYPEDFQKALIKIGLKKLVN
ncbi:MAG: RluA family pseudouridine synthase [Minisyncoccia bacterium]